MFQTDVQAIELTRERRAEADAYRRAAGTAYRASRPTLRARLGRTLVRTGQRLLGEPARGTRATSAATA